MAATMKLIGIRFVTRSSISNPPFKIQSFSDIPAAAPSSSRQPTNSIIPLSTLFQRYGFSPSQLPDFFKKHHFLLNSSPTQIEKSFKTLLSLNPSHQFLVSIVTNCPRLVLEQDLLTKWKNELGTTYDDALEISSKFGSSPDDIFRFLMCFRSLGFSGGTIAKVLEAVPSVIMSNEGEVRGKIEFLMGIGVEGKDIERVVSLFPLIFAFGLEYRLRQLLDEFRDLGISLNEVRREVLRDPTILGLENGELSHCLEMLRSLKCRVATKQSIFRDGELRAGYNVKLRVDCLRKHGLTGRDAFTVLWKEPRIILYDVDDIEKKIEFLVHVMKIDIRCLVEIPEYLGVNFDKQIVPRFKVIDLLRSRGALGDGVGLRNLIKVSRLRFYNLYVKPYPECEKIYGRLVGDVKVNSRHPVGMWKLFRPQQYPKSSEDVNNIKSYFELLP